MTPAYIRELADFVDPDKQWQRRWDAPFTEAERKQRDAGVALRRHAHDLEDLERALAEGKSRLITPIGPSHTARKNVETPPDHARHREKS